jgi:hypothetical protein
MLVALAREQPIDEVGPQDGPLLECVEAPVHERLQIRRACEPDANGDRIRASSSR